ncbi:MAG: TerB N-terminal domain-containing protein, partial [Bacteroidetes bacterium]|nr:TerB N-terminal domain-containing protein [Bacteroidota bacterium]
KFSKGDISLENQHSTQWGEYPLSLKVALSKFSINQTPIPPKYAFSWAEHSPYIYLRTPAKRCHEEFKKLFEIRYIHKFGDGLVVKPNKSSIKIEYRPATNSFYPQKFEIEDMPDVTQLTKPVNQFREIIELCTDELDAYSRFLGRKPEEKMGLEALSLLPEELLAKVKDQKIVGLDNWLRELMKDIDVINIESSQLLSHWKFGATNSLTKAQCISIVQLLGKLGYAIEPDIRFSSNKIDPNGYVVISRLQDNSLKTASKDYIAATTVLQLASAVSAADGNVSEEEELYLEKHLENVLELSELEKRRLRIYLKWSLISTPGFSGMKKRLVSLDSDSKKALAQFLLSVAFADGIIDPGEIKILKKIYGFLELDSESIYSDLHNLQAGTANEPVTIQAKPEILEEFSVPQIQPHETHNGEEAIVLDQKILDRKRRDTDELKLKLAEILVREDTEEIPNIINQNQIIDEEETFLGLDGQHSKLVKELLNMDSLSRSDFEYLCDKYGLMPDGAIETINNNSFDLHDEPFIEEDDDIEINKELSRELLI